MQLIKSKFLKFKSWLNNWYIDIVEEMFNFNKQQKEKGLKILDPK